MTPRPPLPRRTPQGSPSRGAGVPVPPVEWREETARTKEGRGVVRYALVHLGVCSAPVALALAAVIVKGTGR